MGSVCGVECEVKMGVFSGARGKRKWGVGRFMKLGFGSF